LRERKISHIVKVVVKLTGCPQVSLINIYERQVMRRADAILDCVNHPLHCSFEVLSSGRRFRTKNY